MGKKFVGLGGLKHFWTKAKTWIAGQITAEVTAKIAELVANAPEDLDTLKEIADWISTHANDASAMNTQINTNKNDIAALQTSVAGKADTGHTHTKSQITDFAHTHDDRYFTETEVTNMLDGKSNTGHNHDDRYYTESEVDTKLGKKSDTGHKHSANDITSGVLPVANGGTGVTTQDNINKAFIGNLEKGESNVTDGTEFVSSYASNNGFDENAEPVNTPYRRKFSAVWGYIKDKISSVLGLTKDNYGGTAAAILDYNKGTPIKVRWGGNGINSAEWYPAFNADGSALEPINRTNIHAGTADYARNMYYQNLDLSALDKTKFYPLVCYSGTDFAEVAICSESGMGSMEYNQNRIHFDISTMGWSDTPPTLNIREYACYENNEITIGCIGRGVHNGAWAIWLRGGLHYTCFSRNSDLSLHTSNYTFGDETYTVGTNYYGGSNSNVSIWFTPQSTITEGAYSTRTLTGPVIKATSRLIIPIGAPSSPQDGDIWIQ